MQKTYAQLFAEHTGHPAHKWEWYFDIYDRHLSRFRGKAPRVLEIGVWQGGSLEIWERYFGEGCRLTGIDINPVCLRNASDTIDIHIGDQGDPMFWDTFLFDREFDIILDDGSHQSSDMVTTLLHCWPSLAAGGVLLFEDVHACYLEAEDSQNIFSTTCNRMIDDLYHFWPRDKKPQQTLFSSTLESITFHDSITVLEKTLKTKPKHVKMALCAGSEPVSPSLQAARELYLEWKTTQMPPSEPAQQRQP